MNILVCNDDGIYSEGIYVLAKCLSVNHNVLVVATDGNRSGYAHSLSIFKELELKKVFLDDSFESYSLSGTPADCVKFAHHFFKDFKIDLVCAGINKGPNLGTDIIYSGTVSAGIEANALNLPSIAFSSTAHEENLFDISGVIAGEILEKIKDFTSSEYTLNVNIPNVTKDKIMGLKITKLGIQLYTDEYVKIRDGVYKLIGDPIVHDKNDGDCDVEWNRLNYITVTPVSYDKTCFKAIELLRKGVNA